MRNQRNNEKKAPKRNWTRTGTTHQEVSESGEGVITFAQERSGKSVRNVMVEYKTLNHKIVKGK